MPNHVHALLYFNLIPGSHTAQGSAVKTPGLKDRKVEAWIISGKERVKKIKNTPSNSIRFYF